MTEKRGFWRTLEVGAIFLYLVIIGTSYFIQQPTSGWILIGLIAALHLSEMRIALSIGKEKGLSLGRIITMQLLFGFTWWIPLKKGVIK